MTEIVPYWKDGKFTYRYELCPFDKVLVRNTKTETWEINIFSHMSDSEDFPYVCLVGEYRYCVPFVGNEQLHCTANGAEAV